MTICFGRFDSEISDPKKTHTTAKKHSRDYYFFVTRAFLHTILTFSQFVAFESQSLDTFLLQKYVVKIVLKNTDCEICILLLRMQN